MGETLKKQWWTFSKCRNWITKNRKSTINWAGEMHFRQQDGLLLRKHVLLLFWMETTSKLS